jgi:hypothetical protein
MVPRLAGALTLLALVALASTAELGGTQPLSVAEFGLVLLALAAGAVIALGVGTVGYGGGYAIFGGNRRRTNLIAALLLAVVLAVLLVLLIASMDLTTGQIGTTTAAGDAKGGSGEAGGGGGGGLAVALVAAGALLAVLIVGVLMFLARRPTVGEAAMNEDEAVMQALDESIDDLRRERDVRRAIIACYARMERALEWVGSARRPAEAPFEFLVRVLERVTDNGRAARALTELFEQAKFSVEPMGEREKEKAIDALELLRAELIKPS